MPPNPINVFSPSREIVSIERFAGRDPQLQMLSEALEIEGGHVVIYGNAGVGKSSLARQLVAMAEGDEQVAARLQFPPHEPHEFFTILLQCDDSIKSVEELLVRLLSDTNALAEWVPFSLVSTVEESERTGKLSVKIFQGEKRGASQEIAERASVERDLFSLFVESLRGLAASGVARHGILIVIDEYDRIEDKRGMASLLKSLGSEHIKFALVGVATEVKQLVDEHQSIHRQLTGGCVEVPPMTGESHMTLAA